MSDAMPKEFKWFEKPSDILRLRILDIDRPSAAFDNPGDALDRLWDILGDHKAAYTVQDCKDFDEAPEAEGWTAWEHPGQSHQTVAPQLYNWLAWKHSGSHICFNDEPDFQVVRPDGLIINGDIGQTSASCFIRTFMNTRGGSWWMSVHEDGRRHVIIVACHGEGQPI